MEKHIDRYWRLSGWHVLLLALVLVGSMTGLASCGHDDPDLRVWYYLGIQASDEYKASTENEEQGTMSESPNGNVLYTTITRMKQALSNTCPTPVYQGDDAAVLKACGEIYHAYKRAYGEYERNTICVVKLIRTSMDENDVVVSSRTLTTYNFGSLPPGMDLAE